MKIASLFLLAAAACASRTSPEWTALDRDARVAFAQRVVARAPGARLEESDWTIKLADGSFIPLWGLHEDWRKAGERDVFLDEHLARLTKRFDVVAFMEQPWASARSHVLVAIRPWRETNASRLSNEQARRPDLPFASGALDLWFYVDAPETRAAVEAFQVTKWEQSPAQLLSVAKENLRALAKPTFETLGNDVFASTRHDYYDGARLLLDDTFASLPLQGELVAMVPHDSALLVTSTNDPQSVSAMIDEGRRLFADAGRKAVSLYVLHRRKDGEWQPYVPPSDHPLAKTIRELHSGQKMRDISAAREVAKTLHQDAASLPGLLVKPPKGALVASVLMPGKANVIFEADIVLDGSDGFMPWPAFAKAVKLQPVDVSPRAWLMRAPTKRDEAAMAAITKPIAKLND